eukprot:27083-Pelagococcus_subviridis.AAC.3
MRLLGGDAEGEGELVVEARDPELLLELSDRGVPAVVPGLDVPRGGDVPEVRERVLTVAASRGVGDGEA